VFHTVCSLNCCLLHMACHTGAFRKTVAGEVKQLRSLLAQQASPQLSSTIQLLDGPIAAAAAGAGAAHAAASKASKAPGAPGADACLMPALAGAAGAAAAAGAEADVEGCTDTGLPPGTFSSMADALSCLGPTANDLVRDYAEAYASMKENMEIRLRHEQRRGDFLQVWTPKENMSCMNVVTLDDEGGGNVWMLCSTASGRAGCWPCFDALTAFATLPTRRLL